MENSKTFIVLFNVDSPLDSRPLAELIENEHFILNKPNKGASNCETLSASKLLEMIIEKLELDVKDTEYISVEPITDFMDVLNNQEIDVDEFFISYVTASFGK